MKIAVTTSLRENDALIIKANAISQELKLPYLDRQKQSLSKLFKEWEGLFLVYQDRLEIVYRSGEKLLFHPDTAMLRIKSKHNPLLEMIGSEKQTILDATMGLVSDSIVMSWAGHDVTALESNPLIHFIVSHGLQNYQSDNQELLAAMTSIKTICCQSLDYLQNQPDKSVDIIYFDPMFSQTISESDNLSGIKPLADASPLTPLLLEEAKRVATTKIIVKAHYRDTVFERLGFKRLVRPNQKCHYGIIYLD